MANTSLNEGEKLRTIRQMKGIKQPYMAKQLGMTQSNYSKHERKPRLSYELIEKAAKVLEVDPQDILNFDERLVFNIQEMKDKAGGMVFHNFSDKMIEVYESRIKALEEEVRFLRTMLGEKNGVAV